MAVLCLDPGSQLCSVEARGSIPPSNTAERGSTWDPRMDTEPRSLQLRCDPLPWPAQEAAAFIPAGGLTNTPCARSMVSRGCQLWMSAQTTTTSPLYSMPIHYIQWIHIQSDNRKSMWNFSQI